MLKYQNKFFGCFGGVFTALGCACRVFAPPHASRLTLAVSRLTSDASRHLPILHMQHPVAHLGQLLVMGYNQESLVHLFPKIKKQLVELPGIA